MIGQYAVLSDRDIRREIKDGNIILHDPDRDCKGNIQNCSVDITLGPYFYRNIKPIPFLNPWNSEHVHEYWGNPMEALIARSEAEEKLLGLNVGDDYILLDPGETILGHTREFVGGLNHITTMIKAHSSLGRSNVTIWRDAGWGDINFYNRWIKDPLWMRAKLASRSWTLEITNNGTSRLVLPVGSRIGQIIFLYTGCPDTVYSGKYQSCNNLDEMVKSWNPKMMLPKAFLDK
jgi:dCTP deaminase